MCRENQCVEGFYAPALGQDGERVDVEFGDCALQMGGHVRYSDQSVGKRLDIGFGTATESLEQATTGDFSYHLCGVETGYGTQAQ